MQRPIKPGEQFEFWTVLEQAPNIGYSRAARCRCICGTVKVVKFSRLVIGRTKSCGCWSKLAATTHGMHGTPTYKTWSSMKERCLNPNNESYWCYGGSNITVADEWLKFENFVADMGVKPDGMELDRIDNSLGYSKANCRWVTNEEQRRNRSCTLVVNGRQMFLRELAQQSGVKAATIWARVNRQGFTPESAIIP